MSTYRFEVVVEEDEFEDGGQAYHAYCPALPGCHTWGRTHEEALANVREAVALYVEDMVEAGEDVPVGAYIGDAGQVCDSVAVSV